MEIDGLLCHLRHDALANGMRGYYLNRDVGGTHMFTACDEYAARSRRILGPSLQIELLIPKYDTGTPVYLSATGLYLYRTAESEFGLEHHIVRPRRPGASQYGRYAAAAHDCGGERQFAAGMGPEG